MKRKDTEMVLQYIQPQMANLDEALGTFEVRYTLTR